MPREQFGQEYADPKNFKKEFRQAIRPALAVYPDARVEEVAGGILLRPSQPRDQVVQAREADISRTLRRDLGISLGRGMGMGM